MSALAFTIVALVLVGPVPAVLARASWPLRAPRAAIVLWQSIALAAVLSAFSAGIAIASRLFVPGPDGRPSATITSEIRALGLPLWIVYVVVFALTLMVGGRLIVAVIQVAIATRRRRAHHRMLVDLLASSRDTAPEVCTRASGLRILDVDSTTGLLPTRRAQPRRGQPGHAHQADRRRDRRDPQPRTGAPARPARSRPRDVHRGACRIPPLRPQCQRPRRGSVAHRTAGRRRRSPRSGAHSPGPRPRRMRGRPHPVGRVGRGRPHHRHPRAPARRSAEQPCRWPSSPTWPRPRCSSCRPSHWRCRG